MPVFQLPVRLKNSLSDRPVDNRTVRWELSVSEFVEPPDSPVDNRIVRWELSASEFVEPPDSPVDNRTVRLTTGPSGGSSLLRSL